MSAAFEDLLALLLANNCFKLNEEIAIPKTASIAAERVNTRSEVGVVKTLLEDCAEACELNETEVCKSVKKKMRQLLMVQIKTKL